MARKPQVEAQKDTASASREREIVWNLDVTQPSVTFSDTPIVRLELEGLSFSEFVDCIKKQQDAMAADGAKTGGEKYYFREQMKWKLKGYDAAGTAISPTDMDLMKLHPKIAIALSRVHHAGGGKPGEVIQAGDGISSPILYRLGSPVVAGVTKAGTPALVEEIEIQAADYGSIEDVLFADSKSEQALELIRRCARPIMPVGVPGLMRLTDDAVAQISRADGFKVMNDVLTGFFA